MAKRAIGIDIGGTGIKAALVDTRTGELVSERIRLDTPAGGRPRDIASAAVELLARLKTKPNTPVGICFPAVVKHGFTQSAANVSDEWIGLDADTLFSDFLNRKIHVVNDADAGGVAEMKFGAGKKVRGLCIMTTLGTGIGSALFYNGVLIPNSELGHLELEGVNAESRASYAAKERDNLDFPAWAERLQRYYQTLEKLFTPDLFIVGGGISKSHEDFLPLLELKTKIVPAKTKNAAGIIGAAVLVRVSTGN